MHDIAQAAADAARPPTFDDVLARGRQQRARRQGIAIGTAAVAVVTILGVTQLIGRDGDRPQPAPPGPPDAVSTAPVDVPYSEAGRLHVGERVLDTNLRDIRYAAGTTVVGSDFLGGTDWFLVSDAGMVPVVESRNPVRALVSPDGEVVVWVESTSETSRRLVMWDVATQAVVGETEVPVAVTCCDQGGELVIHGVDLDHRVAFYTDRPWLWEPGSDPVPIRGAGPIYISDPWPGGVMFQGRTAGGTSPPGVYGTVDDGGRFERVGTTPVDQGGLWSPDGTVYVYPSRPGEVRVLREGDVDTLPLPTPGEWQLIAFESATAVVLEQRGEQVARCDVVALECVALDQVPTLRTTWADNHAR